MSVSRGGDESEERSLSLEDRHHSTTNTSRLWALGIALGLCAVLGPVGDARAEETVAGTINGLRCVTDGLKCPVDAADPVIETLADFVLEAGGEDYFYLHNVAIEVKESLVLEQVRVTGEVNRRYRSMDVQRIEVEKNGEFKTVWTPARREDDYRQPGATRR